jgi:hypothetical protein
VALGCERILKLLEDIRDRLPARVLQPVPLVKQSAAAPLGTVRPATDPATTLL